MHYYLGPLAFQAETNDHLRPLDHDPSLCTLQRGQVPIKARECALKGYLILDIHYRIIAFVQIPVFPMPIHSREVKNAAYALLLYRGLT